MEAILAFLSKALPYILSIVGFSGVGGLLNWLFKKYLAKAKVEHLGENWGKKSFSFGRWVGRLVTGFFTKLKWTAAVWNSIIEPYFILFLDLILVKNVVQFIKGVVVGLLSDNKLTTNE